MRNIGGDHSQDHHSIYMQGLIPNNCGSTFANLTIAATHFANLANTVRVALQLIGHTKRNPLRARPKPVTFSKA